MEKKKKKEIGIVLLLLVAVVIMTVGFANYTQRLNITGNVTVKGSPWDVHYKTGTGEYTETSGSVAASAHTVGDKDFSFTVTLSKPGDFYETTIVAKNFGTVNAQLKKITMSELTTDQAKYLTYTIKYNNGTTYSATTDGLSTALNAGAEHPVTIRVEYKSTAAQADLPTTDQTITVTGNLDYESV